MKESFKKIISILTIIALLNPIFEVMAVSSETGIDLNVLAEGVCNNNGVCDSGESELNCPSDCGCNNNGVCEVERGENSANCSSDCPGGSPIIWGPDITSPVIYNIISKVSLESAEISWETDENALCQFSWGKTTTYEKEIILENNFYFKHGMLLQNLFKGTTYHFKISCKDVSNNRAETTDQQFTTMFPPDTTPPANILNFEAIARDQKIDLKWQNPADSDFKGVRIMRSTDFYPSDPWSGTLVYDGKGESFTDTGLINGTRYYYTAFTYDGAGNFSSGAIVSAVPNKPGIISPPEVFPPASTTPPEIEKITLKDFNFIQEGIRILPIDGKIKIKSELPLTVDIFYEKIPEVLKTIMITLENKDKKTFSFLLRINKEKTKYEAIILSPEPGTYPFTITILDYKNQSLKTLKGELVIEGEKILKVISWYKKTINWFLIFLVMIIFAILLWPKKKKKQKNKLQSRIKDQTKIIF